MKKQLLLFVSAIVAFTANAQVSLPNGNFESWTTATYEFPTGYTENSNPQTFFQCHTPFNATKTTDAYHGGFALQLTTNFMGSDTCFGYIANPNGGTSGGPSSWTGGVPMTEKPSGIRGYYKYNVASGDSAGVLVVARAGGVNIGTYLFPMGGIHAAYTLFQFTFSPALPSIPDSIIFAAVSSNPMASSGMPGSTLLIDSVSFTGITTQPAAMNGDFESWQSQNIESANTWYFQGGGSNGNTGVSKTTDKVAGSFAAEFQTVLGDNNGVPIARASGLSTGYYDNSCSCQKGGFPFANMVDTLAFYYKYIPMASDSADISLNFKNAGASVGFASARLHAAASYQYMEIPFSLGSSPDSVIVSIQSSVWQDSLLSFIGSDLKIDEMHFKTQPLVTGFKPLNFKMDDVSFYPNPFTTAGTIVINPSVNTTGMTVKIYDVTGRVVKNMTTSDHKITIDRENLENGIYFYELKTGNAVLKTGKIIVE